MIKEAAIKFYAMPNSQHLTRSACRYTLLTLQGLSEEISSDEIERITLGMREVKWRPMGADTVMIWPDFDQEAQIVAIYRKEVPQAPIPFSQVNPQVQSPDLSMGLGKAHNRYPYRGN